MRWPTSSAALCAAPKLIERVRLGYANRTLGYRLPARNRQAGAQLRGLQRLGVIRESGHEHLSGSLVIPVLDDRLDRAAGSSDTAGR